MYLDQERLGLRFIVIAEMESRRLSNDEWVGRSGVGGGIQRERSTEFKRETIEQ